MFIKTPIPNTKKLLKTYGLEIDEHDGVVSIVNGNTNINYGTITIGYRLVANRFYFYNNCLNFSYNSSKSSGYFNQKHMKKITPEQWLVIFENIASSLAKELGINDLLVSRYWFS